MNIVFVCHGDLTSPRGIETRWIRDLGFLPRDSLPEVFQLADVLIQPGKSDPFNAYRFASKLPEALAQKLPVILPYCNLGQALRDGVNALITHSDSMEKLIGKTVWRYDNPDAQTRIGEAGCRFCTQHLNWPNAARTIEAFYSACLHGTRSELSQHGLMQLAPTDFRRVSSAMPISAHQLHRTTSTPFSKRRPTSTATAQPWRTPKPYVRRHYPDSCQEARRKHASTKG